MYSRNILFKNKYNNIPESMSRRKKSGGEDGSGRNRWTLVYDIRSFFPAKGKEPQALVFNFIDIPIDVWAKILYWTQRYQDLKRNNLLRTSVCFEYIVRANLLLIEDYVEDQRLKLEEAKKRGIVCTLCCSYFHEAIYHFKNQN